MNWQEIEKHCGKHPDGTVFESAWWASRVMNYLRMERMKKSVVMEMTDQEWLQERCRMMLTECIKEAMENGMYVGASTEYIQEFVEDFMKRHNLK